MRPTKSTNFVTLIPTFSRTTVQVNKKNKTANKPVAEMWLSEDSEVEGTGRSLSSLLDVPVVV